jgi:hypothetical protein
MFNARLVGREICRCVLREAARTMEMKTAIDENRSSRKRWD